MAGFRLLRDAGGAQAPRRAVLLAAVAFACAGLSVTAISCGDRQSSSAPIHTTPTGIPGLRNIVSDADIGRYGKGTPERTLLEWFQAVQYKDAIGAAQLVDARTLRRVGPIRFRSAVLTVGSALGKPAIVDLRPSPDGKQVSVRLLVEGFSPGTTEPVSSIPTSFHMVNKGKWRLADVNYLTEAGDALAAARQREARKQ